MMHVLLVVLAASALIQAVSLFTLRRHIIQVEVSRAECALGLIHKAVGYYHPNYKNVEKHPQLSSRVASEITKTFQQTENICACIWQSSENQTSAYYFGRNNCKKEPFEALFEERGRIFEKRFTRFFGATWGVIWKQPRFMTLSRLVGESNSNDPWVLTVLVDFAPIYGEMRRSQGLVAGYVLLNTLVFGFLGGYVITQKALHPLHRLLRRADKYCSENEDGDPIFSVKDTDNEYRQLAHALNRMMHRIRQDRQRLQSTVTSLESANADLQRMQREVVQAEKLASVGRLAAGVAHEIGNPIGILIGYLDLLRDHDGQDAEALEYIRRALEETHRIHSIIRNLLDFSRCSKGEPKTVSVHAVLEKILQMFRPQRCMAHIELRFEPAAANDLVLADSEQLEQVFVNLMLNAADALAEVKGNAQPRICLCTKALPLSTHLKPAKEIQIMFKDNGPGMHSDVLDNIFDPFFSTKPPGQGTGLGLAVCHSIVNNMGGHISVRSRVGSGTIITVQLPLLEKLPVV